MRVVVTGATGRMGGELLAAAGERGWDAVGVSASGADRVAGAPVRSADDVAAVLSDADVLVDFTVPAACVDYVSAAATAGVPAVVGTTGFDEGHTAALREAAGTIPVLKAANFARGIQALLGAVRSAVADLPGYDVELTETHHDGKRDAPSGTARTLLSAVEAARDAELERVHGREGVDPREGPGEVGVHVRRAGDVRGEHELLVADNDEVLTLTHRAESRGVFAAGALDAAAWLADDREPGWYDFADVLEADPG